MWIVLVKGRSHIIFKTSNNNNVAVNIDENKEIFQYICVH